MQALSFETAAPAALADPRRVDVACFVGFVGRRPGRPPAPVRDALARSRFGEGPWARTAESLDSLLQLPVVVESWAAFDALYAWDRRPVSETGTRRSATALGAAVRSFFAQGGRRAVIVRAGDPWPHLEPDALRSAARAARVDALLGPPGATPHDPETWRGMGLLFDLPEVSLLALPDLCDLCAPAPGAVDVAVEAPSSPEVFVECSSADTGTVIEDVGLRDLAPPRLDAAGYVAWSDAVGRVRERLVRHHREVLLIASLPLPAAGLRSGGFAADADYLGYLDAAGVLGDPSSSHDGRATASAFVQYAWPWLRTRHGLDLPGRLEPPEGILCGEIARNALARGTFRSVAGRVLRAVYDTEPRVSLSAGAQTPSERLARRACLVAPAPEGHALLSDVTASADEAWRSGGVSRLMGAVLRAARRTGETVLFEASGPALWQRVVRSLEQTLTAFWLEGGLGGASPEEAFSVRCDRSTMTQNDLDAGRLVAEISVLPVAAVERITVVLDLVGGGAAVTREVA